MSFDVNHRASLPQSARAAERARALLPLLDVLFVGDDELAVVTPETDPEAAVRALLAAGPREVVVKRGAHGALAGTSGGEVAACPAVAVPVRDVVGAGDAFTAGYLTARAEGLPLADRLRRGALVAAHAVETHGDWEGLPTRDRLDVQAPGQEVTLR